jgi:hypothetical protein
VVDLHGDALVSWEYVAGMLGYQEAQKDRVVGLINWISSRAVAVAGREIIRRERVYIADGLGTARIYLPVVPVLSVESVVIDDRHVFDNQSLDPSEYHVEEHSGIVTRYGGIFAEGMHNVRISYTGGYAMETMPDDIRKACLEAIQTAWNRQMDNSYGVSSKSMSDGSNLSYELRLSADVYGVFSGLRLAVM